MALQDCWEGPASAELLKNKSELKIPNELTVTINVPHVDSMKLAHLDINATSLVFDFPNLYYLDLNLKYVCNADKGHAKFDKSKKTLTIRVPVEGLTEDSQRAFEENFKSYVDKKDKRMQELTRYDEVTEGFSQKAIIPLDEDAVVAEKPKEETEEETVEEKDEVRRGREQFLQIYKEKGDAPKQQQDGEEEFDPNAEIKYKRDHLGDLEETSGQLLKIRANDDKATPLIQEIKSVPPALSQSHQQSEPKEEEHAIE